ncbi:MAG: phage tail protein [Clostridia bacterium]|nr:phage tail protein [Clostridia bacterium]
MYTIFGKNYGEGEYLLHDLRTTEYVLHNCSSDIERNCTGSLQFDITPLHPHYNDLVEKSTEILVKQDGDVLYVFRVLSCPVNMNKVKTVTCEGELGYLNDSIQRYGEYHDISVVDFFGMIIEKHNACVDESKRFTVGTVNVTDPNDSLYRYAAYEKTWDYINDKLISRLGGYIRVRHVGDIRYIDYVTDYGNISTQTIELGENLIDLVKTTDSSELITVLVPLGAKLTDDEGNEREERLTIEGAIVDDKYYGKDYLEDASAVALRGRIVGTVEFDNVTTAQYLYQAGLAYLEELKLMHTTVDVTAIDMHLTDREIEQFRLGDSVRVLSLPHGLDRYMKIEKMHIDYNSASEFRMTLGYAQSSLTDGVNKKISEAVELIKNVESKTKSETVNIKNQLSEFKTSIEQTVSEITSNVVERTTVDSITEQIRADFATSVTQNSREIMMSFTSQVQSVRDDVYENSGLIESYIRFRNAMIELGRVGSPYTTQLTDEKLSFFEYGNEIAYISGTKLHIVQAEAEKIFTIGNDVTGKYDFIAKANGNLTFKWRDV